MKDLVKYAFTILIVTMVLAVVPTEAEGEIYEDTIRLHILANSDKDEDQSLKIRVRDYILTEFGNSLRGESITEATARMEMLLPKIEKSAKEKIAEWGYDYSVKATLGKEWYETREYEDFSLPAGYYLSLRVIIGRGEGQNWWCVMYPPLCTEIATENAPADDGLIDYTNEEVTLITSGKYNIKFKILEDLSRVFAKNG